MSYPERRFSDNFRGRGSSRGPSSGFRGRSGLSRGGFSRGGYSPRGGRSSYDKDSRSSRDSYDRGGYRGRRGSDSRGHFSDRKSDSGSRGGFRDTRDFNDRRDSRPPHRGFNDRRDSGSRDSFSDRRGRGMRGSRGGMRDTYRSDFDDRGSGSYDSRSYVRSFRDGQKRDYSGEMRRGGDSRDDLGSYNRPLIHDDLQPGMSDEPYPKRSRWIESGQSPRGGPPPYGSDSRDKYRTSRYSYNDTHDSHHSDRHDSDRYSNRINNDHVNVKTSSWADRDYEDRMPSSSIPVYQSSYDINSRQSPPRYNSYSSGRRGGDSGKPDYMNGSSGGYGTSSYNRFSDHSAPKHSYSGKPSSSSPGGGYNRGFSSSTSGRGQSFRKDYQSRGAGAGRRSPTRVTEGNYSYGSRYEEPPRRY